MRLFESHGALRATTCAIAAALALVFTAFTAFASYPSVYYRSADGALLESIDAEGILRLYLNAEAVAEAANQAWAERKKEDVRGLYDEFGGVSDLSDVRCSAVLAVDCVRFAQDFTGVDGATVAASVERFLTRTYHIARERRTAVDEDGHPYEYTVRVLYLSIESKGFEEVCTDLGFDEARAWMASNIRQNLAARYEQLLGDEDLRAGSGAAFDGAVLQGGSVDVVYFRQGDPRWGSQKYGKTNHTLAKSACGPASLAIVIASLTSYSVDVPTMADWSYAHGYYAGSGTSHAFVPAAARAFGLNAEGVGRDGNKVAQALGEGKLVVALMGKGHFTNGGHYIVLRGITTSGQVLVADPGSAERTARTWDLQLVLRESKDADAGGPFWVIWP